MLDPASIRLFDWQVQEAVHGVTVEECRACLLDHGLSVPLSVQHLKVSPGCLSVYVQYIPRPR